MPATAAGRGAAVEINSGGGEIKPGFHPLSPYWLWRAWRTRIFSSFFRGAGN